MKYRVSNLPGGHTLVVASGGRPETEYARVVFESPWSRKDAVKQVADYVQAVREALKEARTARVNVEVRNDG